MQKFFLYEFYVESNKFTGYNDVCDASYTELTHDLIAQAFGTFDSPTILTNLGFHFHLISFEIV